MPTTEREVLHLKCYLNKQVLEDNCTQESSVKKNMSGENDGVWGFSCS